MGGGGSVRPLRLTSATHFVDPEGLVHLCRLIALNKNPGVRPIGIREAVCRIGQGDIQDAAGSTQIWAGQTACTEAAVHAMNLAFHSEDVLLVDASNAFNSLNRRLEISGFSVPPYSLIPTDLFVHSAKHHSR